MKRYSMLATMLLMLAFQAKAQRPEMDSGRHYSRYPQEALEDAEEMTNEALKKNDRSLYIRALLLKTRALLWTDERYSQECIREVERITAAEKTDTYRSILHSFAAQLYADRYLQDRFRTDRRSIQHTEAPEDMDLWNRENYISRIISHVKASLVPSRELQEAPLETFSSMLDEEREDSGLHPALFELICRRAIDILIRVDDTGARFKEDGTVLFQKASVFCTSSLPATWPEIPRIVLKTYQELLSFHIRSGNADALLLADLDRLDYSRKAVRMPQRDSLFQDAIGKLLPVYEGNPIQVEILYRQARMHYEEAHRTTPQLEGEDNLHYNPGMEAGYLKALAICREGIRKYPGYRRIGLLENLATQIQSPAIQAEIPKAVYTGEELVIRLESRNLRACTLSVYRAEEKNTDDGDPDQRNSVPVFRQDYSLPGRVVMSGTPLRTVLREGGLYRIEIGCPGSEEKIREEVYVTRLFSLHRRIGNRMWIEVCDWNSGKPVPGARVALYRKKAGSEGCGIADTLVTGHSGTVLVKASAGTEVSYRVETKDSPSNPVRKAYSRQAGASEQERCSIFTDRRIYRPKQKIHYKGYLWRESPGKTEAISGRKVEVVLKDANGRKIGQNSTVTSRFGTYSGNFALPTDLLNGSFSISTAEGSTHFEVSAYRRPAFEITFEPQTRDYRDGDTIRLKGRASTYSGTAVSERKVSYSIETLPLLRWILPGNGTFHSRGNTSTDRNGEFQISFTGISGSGNWNGYPYLCRITVRITDINGETETEETDIPVWSGKASPSLLIPEKVDKDSRTAFHLKLDYIPENARRRVRCILSRLVTPEEMDAQPDTLGRKILKDTLVESGRSDSIVPDLKGLASGIYLFTASCDGQTAQRRFHLYSSRDRRPPLPTSSWLEETKTRCRPGEKAVVRFGTSALKARVHCTLLNGREILYRRTVLLSDEIRKLEIPVKEAYGKDLWLEIRYVKNKKYIEEVVPIRIEERTTELKISTETFRNRLECGAEEEWRFRILDTKGLPADAEVWGLMYDASLDRLAENRIDFRPVPVYRPFPCPVYRHHLLDSRTTGRLSLPASNLGTGKEVPAFHAGNYYLYDTRDRGGLYDRTARMDGDMMLFGNSLQKEGSGASPSLPSGGGIRKSFRETAFNCPRLRTDSTGLVTLRFKVPESLTRWKFILLATDPEMRHASLEQEIVTDRPLMVRPNLPRFLRSGDTVFFHTAVNNRSSKNGKGICRLEVFLPEDGKILHRDSLPFFLKAGESQDFNFSYSVPAGLEAAGIRISAGNSSYRDGEQHLLAVLPDKAAANSHMPFFSKQAGKRTWQLESQEGQSGRVTLELTSNPIWYAVTALPALATTRYENAQDIGTAYYINAAASALARDIPQMAEAIREQGGRGSVSSPLGRNPGLKSVLLEASPWMNEAEDETSNMQHLSLLLDQERNSFQRSRLLDRLAQLQNKDGGWPWFRDMPSNRNQTMQLLILLAKTGLMGITDDSGKVRMMQVKALRYLDGEMEKAETAKDKKPGEEDALYLYTRSLYRDIPLGGALAAHKVLMGKALQDWDRCSLYAQALLASAMQRYGFNRQAGQVVESLRQHAVREKDSGMYWKQRAEVVPEGEIRTHCALMEAFQTTASTPEEIREMQRWLLLQKQVESWGSRPATVDAVRAIFSTGNTLEENDSLLVEWGDSTYTVGGGKTETGYFRRSGEAGEARPDLLQVSVTKRKDSPTWGCLYLQSIRPMERIGKQSGEISVDKEVFVVRQDSIGQDVLYPIRTEQLQVGDEIRVRLTLRLKRDMSFLHLQDLRASCTEPLEQLSGYRQISGRFCYLENRDASTEFFFDSLPAGTHMLEYSLRINREGSYRDGIATLQSVYAPEFRANSNSGRLEIHR